MRGNGSSSDLDDDREGGGTTRRAPAVLVHDRSFCPDDEPGCWERRQADHPFLTALVAGLVFSALWVALNRGDEPGWLLVTAIGWWVLGYPALNAWLWREGGGRRTRYDQRVRVSRGGAARLGG